MPWIELRRQRYFKLSAESAQLDNVTLRSWLEADGGSDAGWGRKHTIELGGSKIFVKRVPITDVEYENMYCTGNLYRLPSYYHYGFGSAGFNVFRELVTHIKTTNWVMDGAIAGFPLMYHHRIVPCWGTRPAVNMARHQEYVAYWDGNVDVARYVLDRAHAKHELVIFLEHIPHMLGPWLLRNSKAAPGMLDDLRATITFLRKNGIVHFDADAANILTDGERTYLTDFGLSLDRSFALANDEQIAFLQHEFYDYGEILCSLASVALSEYESLPDGDKLRAMERYGVMPGAPIWELGPALFDNIERMHADGLMNLDRAFVAEIFRHRSIITLMIRFSSAMSRNSRKDTVFPHVELYRSLKETGFLRDADSAG